MTTAAILKRAVELCRASVGSRTRLFFELGACIVLLEKHCKQQGHVTAGGVAIRKLQAFLDDQRGSSEFDLPRSPDYWAYARLSMHCFTVAERQAMLAGNISWARICAMLRLPDKGRELVDKFMAGKGLPQYWQMKSDTTAARNRNQREKSSWQPGHGALDDEVSPPIVVPIPRDALDELFMASIKSLVSQVHQCDLIVALNHAVQGMKKNRFGEPLRKVVLE